MSNNVSTNYSHTYYKHHISQYIHIPYHIHTHTYIYIYIKHYSKNLLLTALSYERQKLIKLKALLMEGNITHTWLKNQKSNTWGKSFKCMMKEDKLNQPTYTIGHTLSPSYCTHFSLSIMKSSWKDS